MSKLAPPDSRYLPSDAARRIDRLCDDFEAARKAGQRPRLEPYLARVQAVDRPTLLFELLVVEFGYRRKVGETLSLQEYQELFPEAAELVAAAFRKATEIETPPSPRAAAAPANPPQPALTEADALTLFGNEIPETPPRSDLPSVPGYEILDRLRQGGMGVVYKARQISLNRMVALKMIRTGDNAGSQELARFRIEAEAVARLHHPNIVQIHDFGEYDQRPFFTMEFMRSGDLAARLGGKPSPPDEAVRVLETLARAMAYVHEHNIVHRDLKPANVLLAEDGTPKITDFGLAKRLDPGGGPAGISWSGSASGTVLGTASYMAPEQAGGKVREIGPAADIHGLGAMFYEMLTGQPPFRADTWELTVLQVLKEEPAPPSHLQPDVPADLESICLKCLEKDPAQRYASCQALAEDLRRFQAGEPLSIEIMDEWKWREKWARRVGYELLDVATCGVRDVVYKARELSLGHVVALKVLTALAQSEPAEKARFRAEAQTVARLKHPNIVPVYNFGEQNGRAFFAMEYVEGGSLIEKFPDCPVSPDQAADLVAQLAQAMHHAHQRGIVHGALKPSNVLLTADGIPKIANFGLAVLLEKEQVEGVKKAAFRRLASYMAPELAEGRFDVVGPATDIYALGAVLYKLLTGGPPFLRETVQQTLEQVLTAAPIPPSVLQPAVPRALEEVCLQCLEKDPARRPATAEVLAEALRRCAKIKETATDEFELVPGYDVFEELGRGGLGVVHRARHIGLDRLVALKIFDRLEPGRLECIQAANRAMAQVHHANIVQVYDCGVRDGLLYAAEELVEGTTLDERIGQHHAYPPREAAQLLEILARAMHHMHESGIVHRNLKPRVVLLTARGFLKISSFELARVRGYEEWDGTVVGTPRYMAPEQMLGDLAAIGPASDVYALGAILYQMLTGRYLFRGDTLLEILEQVRTQQADPPRRWNPQVPRRLDAICSRCLHKDPRHRYPSAAALADDLRRFLRGAVWERAVRWLLRRGQGAT